MLQPVGLPWTASSRGRASPRGTARGDGGGGSPRARPAPRRRSGGAAVRLVLDSSSAASFLTIAEADAADTPVACDGGRSSRARPPGACRSLQVVLDATRSSAGSVTAATPLVASRACGSASVTARIPTTRSCSGRSGGPRRHPRARVRAGRLRHPDAQRVGHEGRLEVTAISLGAYPTCRPLRAAAARRVDGKGYGPIVVAREALEPAALRELEIVVPGRLTTAYLVLRLALGATCAFASCRSTKSSTRSPGSRRRRARDP